MSFLTGIAIGAVATYLALRRSRDRYARQANAEAAERLRRQAEALGRRKSVHERRAWN